MISALGSAKRFPFAPPAKRTAPKTTGPANPNWPGYDATVLRMQMVDAPTIVTIRKRRLTGTAELAGVRLQLLDAQGNLIHKWVSGTTPIQSVGWLVAEQIDQLVETCAPTGYKIATTIRFVVQADGTAQAIHQRWFGESK